MQVVADSTFIQIQKAFRFYRQVSGKKIESGDHYRLDRYRTSEYFSSVEIVDVVAAPVAASFVTLSKKQKRVGCLLADIGAETLSMVVFENNNLTSLEVFPIGGADVTNDIALGLKVTLEEAEEIKLGGSARAVFSKKKLDEIISARLGDCFELIERHLKSIGRNALLPGGTIIAGGSAGITGIKQIAESTLKLPAQVAEVYFGNSAESRINDRTWAVACGLSIVGLNSDNEQRSIGIQNGSFALGDSRNLGKTIMRWVSQFLP